MRISFFDAVALMAVSVGMMATPVEAISLTDPVCMEEDLNCLA